jgi:Do/DeqQ family serine protease
MRKLWLVFAQTVTVCMGVLFVVATLKPEWVSRNPMGMMPSFVSIREAAPPVDGKHPGTGYSAAAKRALPSVVAINIAKAAVPNPHARDPWYRFFFGDKEDTEPQAGIGSGVIVSAEGYILTNNHVVEGADDIEVSLGDGRRATAKLVGADPDTDLAVLKIDLPNLPAMTFGDSNSLQVGDVVLAIGNPFGVGQTMTSGIVSALGRNRLGINTFENFIQTDAAINPGNSGGALVDAAGNLMGINTAIYSRSGGSMGIGFAIPVSTARQVLEAIVKEGQVTRGWIGVEPKDLNAELAETFGLKQTDGVIITGVLQGSPAANAGLRPGDVITQVGDKAVRNVPELLAAVAALKPETRAPLKVLRKGEAADVTVTIAKRPRPRKV